MDAGAGAGFNFTTWGGWKGACSCKSGAIHPTITTETTMSNVIFHDFPEPDDNPNGHAIGPMFQLNFGTRCNRCNVWVEMDENGAYVDDELVCETCVIEARRGEW